MKQKAMFKILVTLCVMALAGLTYPVLVYGEEAVQITDPDFHVDAEGRLISYTGNQEQVVIPDGVKSIGGDPDNSIFQGTETTVVSVVIPDSVTEIGEGAFLNCRQLQEVTMGNGVTQINGFAFFGCSQLKSVKLSENLQEIGRKAFCFCESLETLDLPASLRIIEREAFGNCSSLKSMKIPDGVRYIPMDTFFECYSLEKIEIPSSVTEIGTGGQWDQGDMEPFSGLEEAENLTIYGAAGSEAQTYAQEHQIPFVEDSNLQSTMITPEAEEEQKEEKESEERITPEASEGSEEEEKGEEKTESSDRTIILGMTIGAAVLLIVMILLMIRVIKKNRKR